MCRGLREEQYDGGRELASREGERRDTDEACLLGCNPMRQPRAERGTFGSGGRRSIQLSYWRVTTCDFSDRRRLPLVAANNGKPTADWADALIAGAGPPK